MRNLLATGLLSLVLLSSPLTSQGWAQGWQPPTNLGGNVNTAWYEFGNSISQDGTKLYLSTDRSDGHGSFDIWVSEYVGGIWQPPTNLGSNINTTEYDAHPSISSDGTKLYFSSDRAGGYGDFDIWVSEYLGGTWQPPANLGSNINTAEFDACPSISGDGTKLYFVSYRAGGQGESDIWVSEYSSGTWQSPVNLGPDVNTGVFEFTPSISSDGLSLYFASARPGGYGWYDIWVSEDSGGVWQPPTNLGDNINTADLEAGPSISSDGLSLYFAAHEWPGGYGLYDIWVSESGVGAEEASHQSQVTRHTLLRSHPNPFTRTTTISYFVPPRHGDRATRRGGDVSTYQPVNLSIYDLSGRLVRTLIDELLTTDHLPPDSPRLGSHMVRRRVDSTDHRCLGWAG